MVETGDWDAADVVVVQRAGRDDQNGKRGGGRHDRKKGERGGEGEDKEEHTEKKEKEKKEGRRGKKQGLERNE